MGEILEFAAFQGGEDLEGMGREQLLDRLERARAALERLDREEPEDMESEDYEDWARRHEALEDLADDILDQLEE